MFTKTTNKQQIRTFFKSKPKDPNPKLLLHQEIALQGWKKKDWFVLSLIGGVSLITWVLAAVDHTDEKLRKISMNLDSTNDEELIKAIVSFSTSTMGSSDHGGLYIKYEIVDKCISLLSNSNIKVRKEAWKALNDLDCLKSCHPVLVDKSKVLITQFAIEMKKWTTSKEKMENYFDATSIAHSFSSIIEGQKVKPSLFKALSRLTTDMYGTGIYLQAMSTMAVNEENAFNMKDQIPVLMRCAQDSYSVPIAKVTVRRILRSIYKKEKSLDSVQDVETVKEYALVTDKDLVAKDITTYKKMLPESTLVTGILVAAAISIPWSFLRASSRLVPKRGFKQALPLISTAMTRALIGSAIFSGMDELAQNRAFFFPETIVSDVVTHFAERVGEGLSILMIWRYTPYALLPALLAGIGSDRYNGLMRNVTQAIFETTMTQKKIQYQAMLKESKEAQLEEGKKMIEGLVTKRKGKYPTVGENESNDQQNKEK